MESERILVVDDDEKICQILTLYLRSKGYEVTCCRNGGNALTAFSDCSPHLVILDINLPGMSGYEILERLRRFSNIPVIFLSERENAEDRIRGLDGGADDYITKPFSPKELVARIRAVLRRCGRQLPKHVSCVSACGLELDLNGRTVKTGDEIIPLPDKEFELLLYLIVNRNSVIRRDRILSDLFENCRSSSSRTLDVHINRLRTKLGSSKLWRIETVYGVGYRFSVI